MVVRDAATAAEVKWRAGGHTGAAFALAFSPDNGSIASCGFNSTVRLWDVAKGQTVATILGEENRWTHCVIFSADGKTLLHGSADGMIRMWDIANRKPNGKIEAHKATVRSLALSRDGKTMASASWDKSIKIWNVENRKVSKTLLGHKGFISSVAFSPKAGLLASAGGDYDNSGEILLWELKDKR